MNIYRITSVNNLGYDFDIFIVADNINSVFEYLKENSICEITNVEKIGHCTAILKGEDND